MIRFAHFSWLLLLLVGCQSQTGAVNPFAAYGPQRLPPPGTNAYGQAAQTAPYYQAPAGAATQTAPTTTNPYNPPPASFPPPANSYPATGGTYQQPATTGGRWQGVSNTPQTSASSQVALASHVQEVPPADVVEIDTETGTASALKLGGMRVNEASEVVEVEPTSAPLTPVNSTQAVAIAPSPISGVPTSNAAWRNDAKPMPRPSRIP